MPQLQRRFTALASSLVLAVLQFGCHLPQFFLIATYRNLGAGGYAGLFAGLACGAVVLTWLDNRSGGSILLVAVWHGLYNLVACTQAAAGLPAAVVSTLIVNPGRGPDRAGGAGPAPRTALRAGTGIPRRQPPSAPARASAPHRSRIRVIRRRT